MAPSAKASVLAPAMKPIELYNHSYESESSSSNPELSSEDEYCHDSGISDDNKCSTGQKSFTSGKMKMKRYHSKSRARPFYNKQAAKESSGDNDSECSSEDIISNYHGDLNEFVEENPEVNYTELLKKLQSYIACIVSLEQYKTFSCYSDALRLANVTIVTTKSLQLGKFLAMFAHSVSCAEPTCTTTCRMFKRVRAHVASADHSCAMMHVYGQLLRMHVDTCLAKPGTCGMINCKSMKDMREAQGNRVLPADFQVKEKTIAQVLHQQSQANFGMDIKAKTISNIDEAIMIKEEHDVIQDTALNLSTNNLSIHDEKISIPQNLVKSGFVEA